MEQKNTKKVICISVNKADNKKHFEFYNDNNSKYFFVIDNNELFDVYTFARKFNVFLYSIKKYKVCFDLDSFTKIINFDRQLLLNLIVTSIKSIVGNNFSCRSDLILESEKISFVASDNNKKALNESLSLLKAYEHCKHLQSVPSNFITVNKYIEYIKKMFIDVKNVEIEILNHEQLKQRNMNLMLSVCKGNENDGALIVIKYLPIKNQKPIGIIGKGILFDSGGYNIKLNNGMKGMNQDKTGSAITASIAYSLATNNVQTNAIAFLPLCKNMIGLDSSVPGDVYIACDGQSVEITNTDAEGRLLLADTLAYATSVLKIDFEYVITIATLTGLSAITFGDLYTPFWSTNKNLVDKVNDASKKTGENLWNMPLHYEFYEAIKNESLVADYVNSEKTRASSNSVATAFVRSFCNNDNFMHFDIAGTNEFKNIFVSPLILTLYYLLAGNK